MSLDNRLSERDYLNDLALEVALDEQLESATRETNSNRRTGITQTAPERNIESDLNDLGIQTELARKILVSLGVRTATANEIIRNLIQAGDLVDFNRYSGQFQNEIKSLTNITPATFTNLWDRYKLKLLTSKEGITIFNTDDVNKEVLLLKDSITDLLKRFLYSAAEQKKINDKMEDFVVRGNIVELEKLYDAIASGRNLFLEERVTKKKLKEELDKKPDALKKLKVTPPVKSESSDLRIQREYVQLKNWLIDQGEKIYNDYIRRFPNEDTILEVKEKLELTRDQYRVALENDFINYFDPDEIKNKIDYAYKIVDELLVKIAKKYEAYLFDNFFDNAPVKHSSSEIDEKDIEAAEKESEKYNILTKNLEPILGSAHMNKNKAMIADAIYSIKVKKSEQEAEKTRKEAEKERKEAEEKDTKDFINKIAGESKQIFKKFNTAVKYSDQKANIEKFEKFINEAENLRSKKEEELTKKYSGKIDPQIFKDVMIDRDRKYHEKIQIIAEKIAKAKSSGKGLGLRTHHTTKASVAKGRGLNEKINQFELLKAHVMSGNTNKKVKGELKKLTGELVRAGVLDQVVGGNILSALKE